MKTILSDSTKQFKISNNIVKKLKEKGISALVNNYNDVVIEPEFWSREIIFEYDNDEDEWEVKILGKFSEKKKECIKIFEDVTGIEVVRNI